MCVCAACADSIKVRSLDVLFLEKKNKQHDHDDVDDWLYQADCHAMPVLHADCISNDGGVWRYEDPFASDVTPKM